MKRKRGLRGRHRYFRTAGAATALLAAAWATGASLDTVHAADAAPQQILLKADADGSAWTDDNISEAFGCRVQTVENVRRRFVTA